MAGTMPGGRSISVHKCTKPTKSRGSHAKKAAAKEEEEKDEAKAGKAQVAQMKQRIEKDFGAGAAETCMGSDTKVTTMGDDHPSVLKSVEGRSDVDVQHLFVHVL